MLGLGAGRALGRIEYAEYAAVETEDATAKCGRAMQEVPEWEGGGPGSQGSGIEQEGGRQVAIGSNSPVWRYGCGPEPVKAPRGFNWQADWLAGSGSRTTIRR